MKKIEREAFGVMKGLLEPQGFPCRFERGGKHAMCIVTAPDGEHKLVISGSPTNKNDELNYARQRATRLLRTLGAA